MSNLPSLFNLNLELLTVATELQFCIESGCEVPQELIDKEQALLKDISTKIDNCYDFDKFLDQRIESFKETIEGIQQKINSIENMKAGFRKYLLNIVENTPDKKIKGEIVTAYIKNTKAVEVTSEIDIDRKFFEPKTTYKLNKTWIKEAIEAGDDVKGAYIQENKSLVLKGPVKKSKKIENNELEALTV